MNQQKVVAVDVAVVVGEGEKLVNRVSPRKLPKHEGSNHLPPESR